ncbi:MAG: hypothetical protein JWM99_4012 [Verrucomicrobiales bacterium]|nr:hypothetical protein [Verrucomicrobiales bacterium]
MAVPELARAKPRSNRSALARAQTRGRRSLHPDPTEYRSIGDRFDSDTNSNYAVTSPCIDQKLPQIA